MAIHLSEETGALTDVAAVLKAAGEPSRLRILKALETGELCACHLVALLGTAQPTVSRHLAVLRAAGLVEERKEGRWSHYRLVRGTGLVRRLLSAIRSWGEDDPVVLEDRDRSGGFREVPIEGFCSTVRREDR